MTPDGGAPAPDDARPDWRCRFCGTTSGGASSRCRSCGTPREAAAADGAEALEAPAAAPAASPARGRLGTVLAAVALVAALLGAATGYLRSRDGAETVTVTGFEWERTVEVQDHETVREEAWEDEVPEEAHVIARRRQVHHTEKERPVYKHRVAYDVERWSVVRTLKASGRDRSPRWPDIRLNLGEREGKRRETYVVVLQGRGVHRMQVPREQWQQMREGQIGSAVMDASGAVRELR